MFRSLLYLSFVVLVTSLRTLGADAEPTAKEAKTIAAVEKLGGKATIDEMLNEKARVSAQFTKAGDANLIGLGKLPEIGAIEVLNAGGCTLKTVTALKALPNLQRLALPRSPLADQSAEMIGKMTTLKALDLGESKITDIGLGHLGKLTDLQRLDVYDTKITDKGLAKLTALTNLEDLNLSGTKVTDAGVLALKKMTGLKVLRAVRTDVTRKGTEELEKALPKLTVRY